MDELRWALAGIAVVGVSGLYFWEKLRRRRKRPTDRLDQVELPDALTDIDDLPAVLRDDVDDVEQLDGLEKMAADADDRPRAETASRPSSAQVDSVHEKPEMAVAFTVVASAESPILGPRLAQTFEELDMRMETGGLYAHFGVGERAASKAVFHAANILEPGVFSKDGMADLRTPGLVLFMQLPGPLDAPVAYELLLEIGYKLARKLDGELCDERRVAVTAQSINHLREQVAEFERKRLLSARGG